MEVWGWISFIKDIAATKQFDRDGSGMNSIDCVMETSLFDVLLFASEGKERMEAEMLDYEAIKDKSK